MSVYVVSIAEESAVVMRALCATRHMVDVAADDGAAALILRYVMPV